jgi:hypothetical protein
MKNLFNWAISLVIILLLLCIANSCDAQYTFVVEHVSQCEEGSKKIYIFYSKSSKSSKLSFHKSRREMTIASSNSKDVTGVISICVEEEDYIRGVILLVKETSVRATNTKGKVEKDEYLVHLDIVKYSII